jgi:hypothetical protein
VGCTSGYALTLVFTAFSTEESTIMSADFRGFTLSLKENLAITSRLLPSKSFPVHRSSAILTFDTIYSRYWQHQGLRHYATSRKVAVRFPIRSPDFSVHLILPAAPWLWGRLSLEQKRLPGIFLGVKGGRPARKADLPPSVNRLSKK